MVRKIFARIFPNLHEKLWDFPYKISPQISKIMKTVFGMTSEKVFMCFSGSVGCHFLKSNKVGRHFCPNFQQFCSDFPQIKTFGCAPAPHVLYHVMYCNMNMCFFCSVTICLSICAQIVTT